MTDSDVEKDIAGRPRAPAALHKGEILRGADGAAYVSVLEELRWDVDGRRVPHVVSRWTWSRVVRRRPGQAPPPSSSPGACGAATPSR